MATAMDSSNISGSVVQEGTSEEQVSSGVIRLKLNKAPAEKKVSWTNDTVDNEHMGKKKSKCCCVYVRPKAFDESSSEEEGECEHCSGHVEKKSSGNSNGQEEPVSAHSDVK